MWMRLMAVDELRNEEMLAFNITGKPILVIKSQNTIGAFEDKCLHLGMPLSQGCLTNGILTCKAHHWQYNAVSGAGINPSDVHLKRYPLEIREDEIWINV
jgi:toluene monooxygenase system ferredoxin subunit